MHYHTTLYANSLYFVGCQNLSFQFHHPNIRLSHYTHGHIMQKKERACSANMYTCRQNSFHSTMDWIFNFTLIANFHILHFFCRWPMFHFYCRKSFLSPTIQGRNLLVSLHAYPMKNSKPLRRWALGDCWALNVMNWAMRVAHFTIRLYIP